MAVAVNCDHATVWYKMDDADTQLTDECGYDQNMTTVGGTPVYHSAKIPSFSSYSVYYDSASNEYHQVADGAWAGGADAIGVSMTALISPTTDEQGDRAWILGKWGDTTGGNREFFMRKETDERLLCMVGTSDGFGSLYSSSPINLGQNFHVACVFDDANNNFSMWVNGTYNNSVSHSGAIIDGSCPLTIADKGCASGIGDYDWDGTVDEVLVFFGYVLNSTEIDNLFARGDIDDYGAGGGGGDNSTQTLVFGASDHGNGTHHNTAFNWSMVPNSAIGISHVTVMIMNTSGGGWYMHSNHTAPPLANSTEFSTPYYTGSTEQIGVCVNTTLYAVNGSQVSAPGGVACSYISFWDDVTPNVVITSPPDGASYERGARPDLEAYANDTYLLNFTTELCYENGTLIRYDSSNAGGATYLDHNISAEAMHVGSFNWNASAMDSHTGTAFKADSINQNKGKTNLKVESGSDYFNFNVKTVVNFDELDDRIKFKWNETVGATGNLNRNIVVVSATPITIVDWTKYAGHITNSRQWADFDDLAKAGYTVKVTRINTTAVNVAVTAHRLKPGTYVMDPATGGLNWGSHNVSYSITNYSTMLDVGVVGAYLANQPITWQAVYAHGTNSTFITGATCNLIVTDTLGANATYSMNELANYYNWTGWFSLPGIYAWHVACNKTHYNDGDAYGSISIMTDLPEFYIWEGVKPETTCHNTTHLRYTWRTSFAGIEYVRTSCNTCFYGCEGNACKRSLIREGGVWTLLLAVASIVLVGFWVARQVFGRGKR